MRRYYPLLWVIVMGLGYYNHMTQNAVRTLANEVMDTTKEFMEWRHVDDLVSPYPVLLRDESNVVLGVYRRLNYPLTEGLDTTYWLKVSTGDIVQLPAHSFVRVADPYGQTGGGV